MDEEWIEDILGAALGKKKPDWDHVSLGASLVYISIQALTIGLAGSLSYLLRCHYRSTIEEIRMQLQPSP